jgi:hypothetical protein
MYRLMGFVFLIVLLPAISFGVNNGFVAGRVTDQQTGYAVIGATVTISGTDKSTVTDGDGFYLLTEVPAGVCTLSVKCDGCQTTVKTEIIRSNSLLTHNAVLPRSNSDKPPRLNVPIKPAQKLEPIHPVDIPVDDETVDPYKIKQVNPLTEPVENTNNSSTTIYSNYVRPARMFHRSLISSRVTHSRKPPENETRRILPNR